jgi:DNA-binding GntR family transcriptional regulator
MPLVSDAEISQTIAARTADVIRNRILALSPGYAPGERLLPEALAESLGVSMTPVREALRMLGNEGLVKVLPRRGVRVATLSLAEIGDITAVRGGIETLAIRLRGEPYGHDEIKELETCLDACERAIHERDVANYRRSDRQVHRLIVAGSHSPTLADVYEHVHRRAQILELYFTDTWDLYRESLREHREILGLLATGPMEDIERAVWQHWQWSRARVAERLTTYAASGDGQAGIGAVSTDSPVSTRGLQRTAEPSDRAEEARTPR